METGGQTRISRSRRLTLVATTQTGELPRDLQGTDPQRFDRLRGGVSVSHCERQLRDSLHQRPVRNLNQAHLLFRRPPGVAFGDVGGDGSRCAAKLSAQLIPLLCWELPDQQPNLIGVSLSNVPNIQPFMVERDTLTNSRPPPSPLIPASINRHRSSNLSCISRSGRGWAGRRWQSSSGGHAWRCGRSTAGFPATGRRSPIGRPAGTTGRRSACRPHWSGRSPDRR